MEFALRPVSVSDLPLLGEIRRRAIMAQPPTIWSDEEKQKAADAWNVFNIQQEFPRYQAYIASIENKDAGFVSWKADYIATIFILPEFQNYKLGSKLLNFAEEEIARKHRQVWLFAHPYSENFYEKRGYIKQAETEDPFGTTLLHKFQKNFS